MHSVTNNAIMLNVVMLSVVMLNVMAPRIISSVFGVSWQAILGERDDYQSFNRSILVIIHSG
jgi:hypothetical protein